LLLGLRTTTDKTKRALDQLSLWDLVLHQDSAAAVIYVAWEKAVRRAA
jgi:hypothetical protein